MSSNATLDSLAAELVREVDRATAARAQAGLVAEFDGMRTDVEAEIAPISEAAVVFDSSHIALTAEQRAELSERQQWLAAQLDKVRSALDKQPEKIRRGDVWKETKRALQALRASLEGARVTNYEDLLAQFADGDHDLLDSLPAGTPGVNEYRVALNAFERVRERLPQTAQDVAIAEAAAGRLKEIRERVEADAVPDAFRSQWRALRGAGIPLASLTPDFRVWLEEHGVAENVMVVYRSQ
jgi:hypothetical protein